MNLFKSQITKIKFQIERQIDILGQKNWRYLSVFGFSEFERFNNYLILLWMLKIAYLARILYIFMHERIGIVSFQVDLLQLN